MLSGTSTAEEAAWAATLALKRGNKTLPPALQTSLVAFFKANGWTAQKAALQSADDSVCVRRWACYAAAGVVGADWQRLEGGERDGGRRTGAPRAPPKTI